MDSSWRNLINLTLGCLFNNPTEFSDYQPQGFTKFQPWIYMYSIYFGTSFLVDKQCGIQDCLLTNVVSAVVNRTSTYYVNLTTGQVFQFTLYVHKTK